MKKLLPLLLIILSSHGKAQQVFWDQYATGFPTTATMQGQISYADENTVWTFAISGDASGDIYQLLGRSLDGGHTWISIPLNISTPNVAIGSIHAISATTVYCAVYPTAPTTLGGIYKSTDGGVSWVQQPTALFIDQNSTPNFVHFFDVNFGIAQGDPVNGSFEIYTTSDGGDNWNLVPPANIPPPIAGEFGFSRNYEFDNATGTIWFGTSEGRIYRSHDMGITWFVSQSPIASFGSATVAGNIAMKDEFNGILINSDAQIWMTSDSCASWNQIIPNGVCRNTNVAFVLGTLNTYICTGQDAQEIGRGSSYSTDGGFNWININDFDEEDVDGGFTLTIFDSNHGLATGFTASPTVGGTWELKDGVLATEGFQATNAFTASPNPTSGILDISGQNISTVAVFDILGKQVFNNNYGSMNNVSLNLSALNNGVYMVKVTNNAGASSTVKVVKQ